MSKKVELKGYKVFNPDWTCMGKQYTCPGKFEEECEPSVCETGMHFCECANDCFKYYHFDHRNKVAEVIAYGDIKKGKDKCCTNKLEIVREIPWTELLNIVNTGTGCSGLGNSGNCNSGDCNSGNRNSGDCNSGNCNSGNWNSGDWNSGNCNSGNWNSGNCNSGNWNSGNCNSGDCNSGDWNKTDFSSGFFNTEKPKISFFNKQTDLTYEDWFNSEAKNILDGCPNGCEWVCYVDMTDEEKKANENAKFSGGYLKKISWIDVVTLRNVWWNDLPEDEKAAILSIPNFDAGIFMDVTGIDVRK